MDEKQDTSLDEKAEPQRFRRMTNSTTEADSDDHSSMHDGSQVGEKEIELRGANGNERDDEGEQAGQADIDHEEIEAIVARA